MTGSVTTAISNALPVPLDREAADLGELRAELERVAEQAQQALLEGIPLSLAVVEPRFDALVRFHQDLRDALFVELPTELRHWVQRGLEAQAANSPAALADAEPADPRPDPHEDAAPIGGNALGFADALVELARNAGPGDDPAAPLQRALAELLLFEAVRLRLLLSVWQSEDFERLGGEESDVDTIAWDEVSILLDDPALADPGIRPGTLMFAAAQLSVARELADRADALRRSGPDLREQLDMRARLRAALRELRLPESVLLTNALSNLLDEPRMELTDLQQSRPVALEGLSRQAMDQRVSRGRRALGRTPEGWPRRRGPALYDLLSTGS